MENAVTLLKRIGKEVQYSVIITDILLTIYVLWLIVTDTAHWLPGVIFGVTPWGLILLLRANKLFHLCFVHKIMLLHSFAVYLCCVFQAYFGFGILLHPMRYLMFTLGVLLTIQLIVQRCKKKRR